jgi:hypothetical protein
MAVKSKRFREMLEKETQKKQPLINAFLKVAVKSSNDEADKYDRPSWSDKAILWGLKKSKGKKPKYQRSK